MNAAWPLFLNDEPEFSSLWISRWRKKRETRRLGGDVCHLLTKASKVTAVNFRDTEEF